MAKAASTVSRIVGKRSSLARRWPRFAAGAGSRLQAPRGKGYSGVPRHERYFPFASRRRGGSRGQRKSMNLGPCPTVARTLSGAWNGPVESGLPNRRPRSRRGWRSTRPDNPPSAGRSARHRRDPSRAPCRGQSRFHSAARRAGSATWTLMLSGGWCIIAYGTQSRHPRYIALSRPCQFPSLRGRNRTSSHRRRHDRTQRRRARAS